VYSFQACRSASSDADNRVFTIDKCQLTGRVIYIQRAWVGFSGEWKANDNPLRCRANRTCYRRIQYDEIMNCNGKGSCSFSSKVISFPELSIPCPNATEASFIWIKYSCIRSKKMFSHYASILYQYSVYLSSACYQNNRQQQSKVANYAVKVTLLTANYLEFSQYLNSHFFSCDIYIFHVLVAG